MGDIIYGMIYFISGIVYNKKLLKEQILTEQESRSIFHQWNLAGPYGYVRSLRPVFVRFCSL